jgi:hypothetical protein
MSSDKVWMSPFLDDLFPALKPMDLKLNMTLRSTKRETEIENHKATQNQQVGMYVPHMEIIQILLIVQ